MNSFSVVLIIVLSICLTAQSTNRSGSSQTLNGQTSSSNNSRPEVTGNLDFRLLNLTPASIVSVYVSPSESSTWGENLLAENKLSTGDDLTVRFNSNEHTVLWDLKVEGLNGRYAEWKQLKLTEISQITLSVKAYPETVVVAEIE